MNPPPFLLGVELIVKSLESAIELFVETVGLELIERRVSTDPAGEIAVLSAGNGAITLLQPTDAGPGAVLPNRDPRLSQIVFSSPTDDLAVAAADVAERGIPAQALDDDRFFMPPDAVEGWLGIDAAIVVTRVDATDTSEPV